MNETVDPDKVEAAAPVSSAAPAAPAKKKRRWVRLAVFLLLAAAAAFAWRHYTGVAPSTAPAPGPGAGGGLAVAQTVGVAPVVSGDMPITINALGVVTPLATVTVKTQIAGKLMSVGFQEGQIVKAGDFLAQIDSRPYEATLAQAQAQLAKDTALYQQAQSDLARYETLSKQDSIALQQVVDQQFLVAQDKAAMGSDQAQIDTANLNIAYCHIVAPVGGRVGLRQLDPGNYLQPSDATGIVVIAQLDPISVIFSTPEDNLPQIAARVNAGATLPVTALDRANVAELASGTLTTFDNQIDTTTGTFKLRASFANPQGALFPNQFVNVRLLVDTLSGATLVPNAAIQLGADGGFVYLLQSDSTVTARKIVAGPSDAKNTVIKSGLAAGDKVVVDGVDRLREGAKVTVAGAKASSANDAAAGKTPRRQRGSDQGAADAPPPPPGPGP
jgi:multidrug efflux system membrane fusion protein